MYSYSTLYTNIVLYFSLSILLFSCFFFSFFLFFFFSFYYIRKQVTLKISNQLDNSWYNTAINVAKGEAHINPAIFMKIAAVLILLIKEELRAAKQRRRSSKSSRPDFNTPKQWNYLLGLYICLLLAMWQGNMRATFIRAMSPRGLKEATVNRKKEWYYDVKEMYGNEDNKSKRAKHITKQLLSLRDKWGITRDVFSLLEELVDLRGMRMDADKTIFVCGIDIVNGNEQYGKWSSVQGEFLIDFFFLWQKYFPC